MGRETWSWIAVGLLVVTGLATVLPRLALDARALTVHAPIAIVGDADFTAANGVTAGTGTLADPFVIEGWDIAAYGTYGILIADTTAAFVIRNVSVWSEYGYAGVLLRNAHDGRFEDAAALSDVGIEASTRVSMSRVNMSGAHLFASNSANLRFENVTGLWGVNIAGCSGVVFQDNVVESFNTPVYFLYDPNDPSRRGTNYTVVRNRFTPVVPWTVGVAGVDGSTFADNDFNQAGLQVSDVRFSTFRNNTLHQSQLTVSASQNVEVSDNRVWGVSGQGLMIESSSNLTVHGNSLTNTVRGLFLWSDVNATVTANRVTNAGIWIQGTEFSEYTTHTFGNDNVVNGLPFVAYKNCSDLTIDGAVVGELFVVGCRRVVVRGLAISNIEMGIKLVAVDDAVIENNNVSAIWANAPIEVFGGTNLTVRANQMTDSNTGLSVSHATDVTILENTMERNSVGAYVFNTTNGRAFHNNFIHSGWYDQDQARSIDNTNFAWDDGYPSGGNYWSDYKGTDANADGIGDTAYAFANPGGVDRYPLLLPQGRAAIPPVARITTDNPTPLAGQTVAISGYESTDDDGSVLSFSWDFGDGGNGFGRDVYHQFANPGIYTVVLTAKDNSGLTGVATVEFNVLLPGDPPAAIFEIGPPPPLYAGTTLFFNAEGSWTRYGTITSYAWDFGDGRVGSGMRVTHAFSAGGSYHVVLTVTNTWGVRGSTGMDITVTSVPDIPLVMYSHPSGFQLPVPSQWGRTENERIGDTEIDLVLRGPQHDNLVTNIIVDSFSDSTVREDRASMEGLVASVIDEIRNDDPTMSVVEAPTYRTVSGHSAAVFAVQFNSDLAEQKFALVVSEAHQEVWLLLLTVRIAYFPLYNATFERMIDGFVITAMPRMSWILIGIGVIAAVVASVILVVYLVRRRAARRPRVPAFAPPAYVLPAPPPLASARYCVDCGRPLEERDRFCSECGRLVKGPPGPSTPPQT